MRRPSFGGERQAAICRELTKLHETFDRGPLAELAARYAEADVKGEVVLVVGPPGAAPAPAAEDVDALLGAALRSMSMKEAAQNVAEMTGLSRRDLYQRALSLRDPADEPRPPAAPTPRPPCEPPPRPSSWPKAFGYSRRRKGRPRRNRPYRQARRSSPSSKSRHRHAARALESVRAHVRARIIGAGRPLARQHPDATGLDLRYDIVVSPPGAAPAPPDAFRPRLETR
jgi:hypothetical protein